MDRPLVGLGRAALVFCALVEVLLLVGVAGAGQVVEPVPLALLAVGVALALRAAVVGCHVREETVTVRSWLRTYHVPRTAITDVRTVGYSGFANRFSESRVVSMVALEVAGRSVPHELRFSADTPARARSSARVLRDRVLVPVNGGDEPGRGGPGADAAVLGRRRGSR